MDIQGSDGCDLLNLIDNLRNSTAINKTVPLPQIIVIGQQSSGKSSVLNAISGLQFPTGDSVVTQFATEIILRRASETRTKVSIGYSAAISESRKEVFDDFSEKHKDIALASLPSVISDAKKIMNFERGSKFCKEKLVLEVCGPKQDHLTLIDLPGFITSTWADQRSEDIEMVKDLVKGYMDNERAIILATFTGKSEFESQYVMEILKKPGAGYQNRALGVITAPDAIEEGSSREDLCIKFVANTQLQLQHGWHALRNLKGKEIEAGLNRNEVESDFFKTRPGWRRVSPRSCGVGKLKKRLARILEQSIIDALPDIAKEVEKLLGDCEKDLKKLGNERTQPQQQNTYLNQIARNYNDSMTEALYGKPHSLNLFRDDSKLRPLIQRANQNFAEQVWLNGHTWAIKPMAGKVGSGGTAFKDLETLLKPDDLSLPVEVDKAEILALVENEVKNSQGRQLPNQIESGWVSAFFRLQCRRWHDIATQHVRGVHSLVEKHVKDLVLDLMTEENCDGVMNLLISPQIDRLADELEAKVDELMQPYRSDSILTMSRRFSAVLEAVQLKREKESCPDLSPKAADRQVYWHILDTVQAFYAISVDTFIDNVESLAIENCLLRGLPDMIPIDLIERVSPEKLAALGGENEIQALHRAELLAQKKQLEHDLKRIKPHASRARQAVKARPSQRNTKAQTPKLENALVKQPNETSHQPEIRVSATSHEEQAQPVTPHRITKRPRGVSKSPRPSSRHSETGSLFDQPSPSSSTTSTSGRSSSPSESSSVTSYGDSPPKSKFSMFSAPLNEGATPPPFPFIKRPTDGPNQ